MTVAAVQPRPRLSTAIAVGIAGCGLAGFLLVDHAPLWTSLSAALTAIAIAAALLSERFTSNIEITPSFVVAMLALGLAGPAAAYAVPLLAEAVTWLVVRYRWRAFVVNIAAGPTPSLFIGIGFAALGLHQGSAEFYVALAAATGIVLALNSYIVTPLMNLLDGGWPLWPTLASERELIPTGLLSAGFTLVVAAAYVQWGLPALGLAVLVIATVAYMERLVGRSREQTRQYANLSWGVLSSLVRTLNERDHRASRHCAAVAMFSRDIAELCGFDAHEQELAHTAGLLHDIGKFTLSDRVMERGTQLDESDWRGIRRHPDIGADLLQDIGVFGPIGEIVRCHHERLDGRGYPRGLTADEIPEVAKIVAVAEVYDTLTAPDTYRTPMNSFEALNELRRVSGAQLDGRYVDALATLLAGRGTDYRHQDEADFDRELDMERRMSDAATPA